MTAPLPPLVTIDDPDYALYKSGDPEYLLRVSCAAIRDYCGWHIAPSITETHRQLTVGSKGIVILPSRYVTAVSEVTIHDHSAVATPVALPPAPNTVAALAVTANVAAEPHVTADPVVLDPNNYEWFQEGWMQGVTYQVWGWSWPGSYYGPDAPYYAPIQSVTLVDVTMTHGYDTLPDNLKQIAFELASNTGATSGLVSGVKTIQSPQYSTTFSDDIKTGMTFTDDQMHVLDDYRLGGWFA